MMPHVCYLRYWFWGIIPNWPWPWPATGVFHGILLVSDSGPTGFLAAGSAHELNANPPTNAASSNTTLSFMART